MTDIPEFNNAQNPDSSTPDEEILARFIEAGRIKQLPAQHTKRLVVLTWLANQFEAGRQYPESEVNEMLKGHSVDHAALRRYMVDYGFLMRTGSMYELAGREGAEPNVHPEE
jgi:hypothetical protein